MINVIIVKEEPKKIKVNDMVIYGPNFLSEIGENRKRAPSGRKITAINHLKFIMSSIFYKYCPKINPLALFSYGKYEGVEYRDDYDINKIIVSMISTKYPIIFAQYLEHHIKSRSKDINTIYYVDNGLADTGIFLKYGFDIVTEESEQDIIEKMNELHKEDEKSVKPVKSAKTK